MTEHVAILFRFEAGLLAFILAFYALCARERRAPHITHTVYAEIGLVLFAVLATLLALVTPGKFSVVHNALRTIAQLLLAVAIVATLVRVFSIANRDLRLRDDKWWLAVPGIKQLYIWRRRRKHEAEAGMSYEHQSLRPADELTNAIVEAGWPRDETANYGSDQTRTAGGPELSLTLSLLAPSYRTTDPYLIGLAGRFLAKDAYVQYTPCARHPTEFLVKLKSHWTDSNGMGGGAAWEQVANQVVVVDAYTPHFGFYDSVHDARKRFVERQLAVTVVRCRSTFAGIHSATADAFKVIKARSGGEGRTKSPRKPALLIFEAAYALVDLESPEQYRRFLRHVIPSERMWGSMFTLVTELGLDAESRVLLRGYSDFFLDELDSSMDGKSMEDGTKAS